MPLPATHLQPVQAIVKMALGPPICHCEEAVGRRGNLGKAVQLVQAVVKMVCTDCVCSGAHCAAVGGFAALRMRRPLYGG